MELSDDQLESLQESLDDLLSEAEIIKNEEDEHVKVMFNFQKLLDMGRPISAKNIADLINAVESYEAEDPDTILPMLENIRDLLG